MIRFFPITFPCVCHYNLFVCLLCLRKPTNGSKFKVCSIKSQAMTRGQAARFQWLISSEDVTGVDLLLDVI